MASQYSFPQHIFREYDIRGVAETELSNQLAQCLGYCYAQMAAERRGVPVKQLKIAVGRDVRLSSDRLFTALCQGLFYAGVTIQDLGVCPTPAAYFSVFNWPYDGVLMITGSHNPGDMNGFKMGIGHGSLYGQDIQDLKIHLNNLLRTEIPLEIDKVIIRPAAVAKTPVLAPYIQAMVERIQKGTRKLKVVVDAGNGTGGLAAPEALRKIGAEVIELYCEIDGRFPNHHPDPTVASNLKVLCETVVREKADLGIALDGDSDRLGIVDEKGNVWYGDEIMVVFSRAVLKEIPGATIISEVKSSHRLYADIRKNGGNALMWKTGHSLIKAKMKECKAPLAGEMSGHIFFNDRYFGFDDGIYSGLRFYEIVSKHSGPASSLIEDLPPTTSTPEIRIDCQESLKFDLVTSVRDALMATVGKEGKVTDIDGIRLDFDYGWGLLRASNTQAVLSCRFEASSEGNLKKLMELFQLALDQACVRLKHPSIVLKNTH
jgi:phosphomannomutase / phosphoglucomutase